VSPFAAGCAICGYDLMTAREERAQRRAWMDRVPTIRFDDEWVIFGLCLLVALAAPIAGFILGAFVAWRADEDGDTRRRNLMFVVIGVSVLQMATGYGLFGRFIFGY
jgi:hypothetical protein